ncbi:hypothetical protein D9757_000155 [Collybiopsis confluens]|uniref:Pantothenate transporter liz1 n=1 Tax=Collybiopsis confluens TaxID=2823264 RepID=A0A8H5I3P8_9AGAR|nr:hypothetical protein D9757_000155 [Collybiopsis confluens]
MPYASSRVSSNLPLSSGLTIFLDRGINPENLVSVPGSSPALDWRELCKILSSHACLHRSADLLRFSGVLQGGIYKNLNGNSGKSGWRWLFIIDGVITLPIAFYGFWVFPDVPATTKVFYLTEEERRMATERLQGHVKVERLPLSWSLVKRVLSRWRWYACSLLFAISGETESFGSNNLMGQWLAAIGGYSVEQIDYYPAGVTAFAICSTLVCATWTDHTKVRWPVLVYMSISGIVASICILAWSSPIGLKFFAYYLAGASYSGQATTFAWANQICADNDQERAIVLASMNMWNNVVNAWWSIVFYPATDAPKFTKGMIAMIAICVATLAVTALVWYLEGREHALLQQLRDDGEGPSALSSLAAAPVSSKD